MGSKIKEYITKKEVIFWLLFFLLNMLLFLPWYIFSLGKSDFFPYKGFLSELFFDKLKFIFIRYNYDVFRISIDLVLLLIAYQLTNNTILKKGIKYFTQALFLLLLLYQIYSAFFQSIYQTPALLYNDFPMLENGFRILSTSFSLKIGLFILLEFGIFFMLIKLVKATFNELDALVFGKISKGIIVGVLLLSSISLLRFREKQMPVITAQLLTINFMQNITQSIKLKFEIEKINLDIIPKINKSLSFSLKEKPNIYFLFIESYGSINLNNPILSSNYVPLLKEYEAVLGINGWKYSSILSNAPVSGGGSWLSYTTIMLGYKVDNRSLYNTLLSNKKFQKYNHLFRNFQNEGYINYRLNPIFEPEGFNIPWDLFTSFYTVDEWIRLEDLMYDGTMYGYGPSPPDQYSLNKAHEIITSKRKIPFVLFSLSKNSHTPFPEPYEMKSDWRDWNDEKGADRHARFFEIPKIDDYRKSIKYQLDNIFDFIIKKGTESDVFVIVGDHQPPAFETIDFKTPIHVISKDSSFVSGFSYYGFSEGLLPSIYPEMNHEGFYSMFLREFVRNYGVDSTNFPIYYPDGINF